MNNRISIIKYRLLAPFFVFIIASFVFPLNVFAHRITVFAWVDGDVIQVEGKFPGGRKVVEGDVKVIDADGNIIVTGKTDQSGEFKFPTPDKGPIKIVLDAGPGHRAEWSISNDEILEAKAEQSQPVLPLSSSPVPAVEKKSVTPSQPASLALTSKEVEAIVERVVDRKLKPVMRILADLHDKGVSLSDIMAGIGYMFGLFGVACYFSAKKK